MALTIILFYEDLLLTVLVTRSVHFYRRITQKKRSWGSEGDRIKTENNSSNTKEEKPNKTQNQIFIWRPSSSSSLITHKDTRGTELNGRSRKTPSKASHVRVPLSRWYLLDYNIKDFGWNELNKTRQHPAHFTGNRLMEQAQRGFLSRGITSEKSSTNTHSDANTSQVTRALSWVSDSRLSVPGNRCTGWNPESHNVTT